MAAERRRRYIITTKSGSRKENGLGITYNTNMSIDQVNRWPDYQYEYGEGRTDKYYSYLNSADGPAIPVQRVAAGRAFGPKFDGQEYFSIQLRMRPMANLQYAQSLGGR